jgi:hypothetical protein
MDGPEVLPLLDLHNLPQVCHSGLDLFRSLKPCPALSEIVAHQAFGCPDRRIPAVVVGGELNGLGVCRSLAAVWVADTKRLNPALWSRHHA